jgi:cytochrome c peroxidase
MWTLCVRTYEYADTVCPHPSYSFIPNMTMRKFLLFSFFAVFFMCFAQSNTSIIQSKADNATVKLGETLFFEKRLSRNGTRACASCHAPEIAFSDGYRRSLGIEADLHKHNAPSLFNAAAMQRLTWADSTVKTFEQQMQQPFFGTKPLEMGLRYADTTQIIAFLQKNKTYAQLFEKAQKQLAWRNIETAIAAFLQTLRTDTSAHKPLSEIEKQGKAIFFAQKTQCATCHPPPYYTIATRTKNAYFNIGLHQKYPKEDSGLQETTHEKQDNGKFRVPSLVNVSKTAPYMHDGSVASLSEVITIFEQGGLGKGKKHPQKAKMIRGFRLTTDERQALLAFLYSL